MRLLLFTQYSASKVVTLQVRLSQVARELVRRGCEVKDAALYYGEKARRKSRVLQLVGLEPKDISSLPSTGPRTPMSPRGFCHRGGPLQGEEGGSGGLPRPPSTYKVLERYGRLTEARFHLIGPVEY